MEMEVEHLPQPRERPRCECLAYCSERLSARAGAWRKGGACPFGWWCRYFRLQDGAAMVEVCRPGGRIEELAQCLFQPLQTLLDGCERAAPPAGEPLKEPPVIRPAYF